MWKDRRRFRFPRGAAGTPPQTPRGIHALRALHPTQTRNTGHAKRTHTHTQSPFLAGQIASLAQWQLSCTFLSPGQPTLVLWLMAFDFSYLFLSTLTHTCTLTAKMFHVVVIFFFRFFLFSCRSSQAAFNRVPFNLPVQTTSGQRTVQNPVTLLPPPTTACSKVFLVTEPLQICTCGD